LAYRDGFICGAEINGLTEIPETILSWAIDRAIQNGVTSQKAGRVFADCYYKLQMRHDFRDKQRREGVQNREAYLLAVFADDLKQVINKLL